MQELVRIRQQQQTTEQNMKVMGQRVLVMEQRQQQILSFLAKAMQNPSILAQIVQQNEGNKRFEILRKKRRLPKETTEVEKDHLSLSSCTGQIVKYQATSTDPSKTMLIECSDSLNCSYPTSHSNFLVDVLQNTKQDVDEHGDETSTSDSELLPTSTDMLTSSGTLESLEVLTASDESSLSNLSNPLSTESAITCLEGETTAMDQGIEAGESISFEMRFPSDDEYLCPEHPNSNLDDALGGTVMNDNVWQQFLDGYLALEQGGLGMDEDICINHDLSYLMAEDSRGGSLQSWSNKSNVEQLTDQLVQLDPSSTGF
ncbi:hypothetical protein O6H91_07G036400 [Diphasiastrum complanatum]|nr:hypothetical protein O6H91_07G036400 [Diphasiastrum complanatum]